MLFEAAAVARYLDGSALSCRLQRTAISSYSGMNLSYASRAADLILSGSHPGESGNWPGKTYTEATWPSPRPSPARTSMVP